MSIQDAQALAPFPATRRRPPRGRAETLAFVALAAIAIITLAAWRVPPLLDWSRYRGAIASTASLRLGRHVTIGGQIRLTLLPRAMLQADDVTLADRGDGISARIGTMRLEVSLGALLAGRVVPRSLTLDQPVVTLPWPLPRGAAPGIRPSAAAADFSASMEGGMLRVGGLDLRAIAATFRTDPDTGAFSAQGAAVIANLPWRFTALVGAPGGDGVSPLTLTLDGQAPYGHDAQPGSPIGKTLAGQGAMGTGAAFHGRLLAEGTIAGVATLRGPDLSLLGPAPALPWQVQGELRGDGAWLRAPALRVLIGTAPGLAGLDWHLAAPASVTLHAALGQVPLSDWAWTLLRTAPAIAGHARAELDLSATAAQVAGGSVLAPHLVLSIGPAGAVLRSATATLPGAARIAASGTVHPGRDGFTGTLQLAAPDLRRTLHWLAPAMEPGLPPNLLTRADLRGDLALSSGKLAWTRLAGQLDDATLAGSLTLGLGARPSLGLDLGFDRLSPAAWFTPAAWLTAAPGVMPSLGALARPFAQADATITLRVETLDWPGLALRHAVLDARGDRDGLAVRRLAADLPGGHLEISGTVAPDSGLAKGQLDLAAPEAGLLPAAWRVPADLWRGPFHLALSADGPASAMVAQLRADLGDLRAEAEARIDQPAGGFTATATLRHPGAPRLLNAAGLAGTESWLDYGSFAALAHLSAAPGHLRASSFSIAAASLHLDGALDLDLTGALPAISGSIDAANLALPGWFMRSGPALPWAGLRGWQGDIALKAARLTAGLVPVAHDVSARLTLAGGVAALENLRAAIAGGRFTGRLAADATQDPPALAGQGMLEGAALPVPDDVPRSPRLAPEGGTMDLTFDLTAHGHGAPALRATAAGTLSGAWRGTTLPGVDLAALDSALLSRGPKLKARLAASLSGGQSGGLNGPFSAHLADGSLFLDSARLDSSAGAVTVAGAVDLAGGGVDLRYAVLPALPGGPGLGLRIVGPGLAAPLTRAVDSTLAMAWAGQGRAGQGRAKARQR